MDTLKATYITNVHFVSFVIEDCASAVYTLYV